MEIVLNHQILDFRHSGKPFELEDIQTIAHQTSLKDRGEDKVDESEAWQVGGNGAENQEHIKNQINDHKIDGKSPENTGKFGTGFLTTYLLSKIVQIKGIFIAK